MMRYTGISLDSMKIFKNRIDLDYAWLDIKYHYFALSMMFNIKI